MQGGGAIRLLIMAIFVAVTGFFLYNPIKSNLNLGLDLQGGLHVVLEAQETEKQPITKDTIDRTIEVLNRRIDETGVKEPIIQPQGEKRIIIELAGVGNPEDAVDIIGKTAVLEFKTDDGKVVLTGEDLTNAQTQMTPAGVPEIALQFTSEGASKFAAVTTANVGRVISIYLDEDLLTDPVVNQPITDGRAVITGNRSVEEAENIARLLRAGSLPVDLEIIEKRVVGATLGADSLEKSKVAGIIGIGAVLIFMIAYYRLPGLLANFALLVYAIIVMGALSLLGATLTLPGIAGFLLSIGMAVDANVIIFERIREELRDGRSLRTAIDAGFKRAFITVFDANVTTLIITIILFYLGTGPIRGFAVTLSIGILASMFTAVTFTRWLLKWSADTPLRKNLKLFGA